MAVANETFFLRLVTVSALIFEAWKAQLQTQQIALAASLSMIVLGSVREISCVLDSFFSVW